MGFRDYLRSGRSSDDDGDERRLPVRVTRSVQIVPEDEAETDFSFLKDDQPNTRRIPLKPKHPLVHNMGFAALRSAGREFSIFCHRMIQRDW